MPLNYKSPKDTLRTLAAELESHLAAKSPIPEVELELAKVAFLAAKGATKRPKAIANRKQPKFPSDFGIVEAALNSPELRQRIGRLLTKADAAKYWKQRDLETLPAAIVEDLKIFLSRSWPKPVDSGILMIRGADPLKLEALFDEAVIGLAIAATISRHALQPPIPSGIIENIPQLVLKSILQRASTAKSFKKAATEATAPRRSHRTSSAAKSVK